MFWVPGVVPLPLLGARAPSGDCVAEGFGEDLADALSITEAVEFVTWIVVPTNNRGAKFGQQAEWPIVLAVPSQPRVARCVVVEPPVGAVG